MGAHFSKTCIKCEVDSGMYDYCRNCRCKALLCVNPHCMGMDVCPDHDDNERRIILFEQDGKTYGTT
jgi:hypothetical protein